jgi:tetratricopeptide (TPR) repeat protein
VPEDRTEAERLVEVCQHLLWLGGWSLGQTEQESRALLDRGTRAADHHGDLEAQVRVRVAYANTRITRGRIAEYLALARENAQLAARSDDEALRALTCFEVGTAEGFAGNLDDCEQALDAFLRSTPGSFGIDAALGRAVAHGWHADMLQYRGRGEEGAAAIVRAREMAASANPLTQMLVGCNILTFAEGRGECTDAMEVAARMMKAAEEFGAPNLRALARAALARAHALRGEWQKATRLFEEASAIGNQHGVYLECEGRDLASLAHAYVELGQPQRAREVAQRAVMLAQERGSRIQELENVVALARAEVAVGHDDAVAPLLARAETLIAAIGAVKFHPHLAEIRAERARRRGDQATWRAELNTARHLFTEMGATGHAERVLKETGC